MFETPIRDIALLTPEANEYFTSFSMYEGQWQNDLSLTATLRYLLHDRYSSTDDFHVVVYTSDSRDNHLRNIRNDSLGYWELSICSIIAHENIDITEKYYTDQGYNFKELSDIGIFLKQKGVTAKAFIDEEKCLCHIDVWSLNYKSFHLLQSLLPRYFPKLFKDKPLEQHEIDLLRSLTMKTPDEYIRLTNEFTKRFNFRENRIRKLLHGFESRADQQKLDSAMNNERSIRMSIEALEREFANYMQQLEEVSVRITGLQLKIRETEEKGEESELLNYILSNKSVEILDVTGGTIKFMVKTCLDDFDPDLYEIARKNSRSFLYYSDNHPGAYTTKNAKLTKERLNRFYKAIFEDEVLRIRLTAVYQIDTATSRYSGCKNQVFNDPTYTPNQHINYHGCLGNNNRALQQAMMNHDYITAIETCVQSCKNINLSEGFTTSLMLERLFDPNCGKVIEMPDKSVKTPIEAIEWLENEERKKENEQTD